MTMGKKTQPFEDVSWVIPLPSNSHHQEYSIFRIGNPNLNFHLPLLLGRGTTQDMKLIAKIAELHQSTGDRRISEPS